MIAANMSEFYFAHPLWLIALLPVVIFLLFYKQKNSWSKYFKSAQVSPRYYGSGESYKIYWLLPPLLLYCSLVLMLADPVCKKIKPAVSAEPVVILADVSYDTPALSVILRKLITGMKQSFCGVIVYSGSAHVLSPVTRDKEAVLRLYEAVSTDIMPVKGNRPDLAVQEGIKLLRQSHYKKGRLLLITSTIAKNSISPLMNIALKYQQPVDIADISVIEKNSLLLQKVAKKTSGNYLRIKQPVNGADFLLMHQNEYQSYKYRLLLFVVISLLLMSRRMLHSPVLVLLLIVSGLNMPAKVNAINLHHHIHRAEQAWTDKNYQQAAVYFGQLNTVTGYYNQGNAYAKGLQFKKALESYNKVLKLEPEHKDARFNRQLILNFFAQQKQTIQNKQEVQMLNAASALTAQSTTTSSPQNLKRFLKKKFLTELKNR